ncbi:MAG: OmpA family protein [Elusimicrobia bacterium]|nr:OmpA family protein [Elusimicrobiota bacterium]
MPQDRFPAAHRLMRCALFALLAAVPAAGQGVDAARLSKQMQLAVDLYHRGDDLEAMDRFMEVLVKGDPAERSMANEYLNRITHRMASGARIDRTEGAPPAAEPVGVVRAEPAPGVSRRAPVETAAPEAPTPVRGDAEEPAEPTPSDREAPPARSQGGGSDDRRVMKEEIDGKIKNRTRDVVSSFKKWEDVTVRMANSRLPRAIGFKSAMLFDDGVKFKKDAGRFIDALSDLIFTLGATQVVILPEGALFNDAKIMDMRRTMAVSALLMKSGISPARMRVNLLTNQVDIPRDMSGWRGVLIVFMYNQPLNLSADSEAETDAGPPVSLGVSPPSLDPREGEGSIIELSVMEPPAGLMSWRFQLLGPGAKPEDDMSVLQEVKGAVPVFHQIYWNGRKRYFGDPLPAGRYEAVLTATDMRNRTQRARTWVQVKGEPPPAAAALAAKPPPAELDPEDEMAEETAPKASVRKPAAAKASPRSRSRKGKAARVRRRVPPAAEKAEAGAEKPAATGSAEPTGAEPGAEEPAAPARKVASVEIGAKPAAPAASEEGAPRAGAVNYQVMFQKGTTVITKEGEAILARVNDTMHYYPLDNINLVGYAYNAEPDAAKLAAQRAERVSSLLVERHGMKAERIKTSTMVVDFEAFKVEIYIVEGTQ